MRDRADAERAEVVECRPQRLLQLLSVVGVIDLHVDRDALRGQLLHRRPRQSPRDLPLLWARHLAHVCPVDSASSVEHSPQRKLVLLALHLAVLTASSLGVIEYFDLGCTGLSADC